MPESPIIGVLSAAESVHPVRSIFSELLLYSSSHSPLAEFKVPIQAISLITGKGGAAKRKENGENKKTDRDKEKVKNREACLDKIYIIC
jgi:hypothetical protein